ncbi:MAG: nickel pincer cofactor biosynthesis protein LarB [Gemmatimonadota bacterium]|jgi:NCAIR mutase (PurE)-related protein
MTRDRVLELLHAVAGGRLEVGAALHQLSWMPVESLADPAEGAAPFARLDHHRGLRTGHPEVVYCPGKTVPQIVEICERLREHGTGFLATRADDETRKALASAFPDATVNDLGRIVHLAPAEAGSGEGAGVILVASGGTADLPAAEEAAVTAAALGNPVERLYDVGVAGLHRLLESSDALARAAVIIAVAGMEGALPSVIAGLVAAPVIAVPTSTGYGASFGGLAALLAMLNSCASGLTVVNIDNGFGAACAAHRITHPAARRP